MGIDWHSNYNMCVACGTPGYSNQTMTIECMLCIALIPTGIVSTPSTQFSPKT
jgi:hypothetical protein